MGNSLCYEQRIEYSPSIISKKSDSIYNRDIWAGSLTLQSIDEVQRDPLNIMNILSIGQYMPCYKNDMTQSMWKQVMSCVQMDEDQINDSCENRRSSKRQDIYESYRQQGYDYVYLNEDLQILKLREKLSKMEFMLAIQFNLIQIYFLKNKTSKLVAMGPPQNLRWACWKSLLLEQNSRFCQQNLYENLIDINCGDINIIKKDVNRTLNRHPYFSDQEEESKTENSNNQIGQQQLIRVLNAIANVFPQLGYCQGMNFITGLMLMVSGGDESTCFSAFMSLLISPQHMLYFLYCEGMPFHDLLSYIVKKHMKQHFSDFVINIKNLQIPDSFWISKMMISLFLYNMDINNCVRAWDYIISRGAIRSIPELITSLMSNLQHRLKDANFEDFASIFQGYVLKSTDQRDPKNSLVIIKIQHLLNSFYKKDQGHKIGEILYAASNQYRLPRKMISDYTKKFILKNKKSNIKSQFESFHKLFTFIDDKDKYENKVQEYLNNNIQINI